MRGPQRSWSAPVSSTHSWFGPAAPAAPGAATADSGAIYEFDTIPGPIQPIPLKANLPPGKVALGRRLFNEPRLSVDDTISCASCHFMRKGGADDQRFTPGLNGELGETNVPTFFNASFNFKQFWDGRADTLEEQVEGPLFNATEMATDWETVEAKLSDDPTYVAEFEAVYADGVTRQNVADAIATFQRAAITPNARFDQYLRGASRAISEREIEGYNLFTDLGCVVCHQGVNLGGTLFQRMGKMDDYFEGREISKADLGRFNVTGRERDRFVFKVPGLRNVELTPPYFHDGSAATLEEAVLVMGRVQLGYDLTSQEVGLLVDFLKTLTGETPNFSS